VGKLPSRQPKQHLDESSRVRDANDGGVFTRKGQQQHDDDDDMVVVVVVMAAAAAVGRPRPP